MAGGAIFLLAPLLLAASAPWAAQLEATLSAEHVGGEPLADFLSDYEPVACSDDVRPELEAGLESLRLVHRSAVERDGYAEAWRAWRPRERRMSAPARDLVTAWMDDRAIARRRFFCDDGLPEGWRSLSVASFVEEAAARWAAAADEAGGALDSAPSADAERAIVELMELRGRIEDRFDAQFHDGLCADERAALSGALDAAWGTSVEPFDLGFMPRHSDPIPASTERVARVRLKFGDLPDPIDIKRADDVKKQWDRERGLVLAELTERRKHLGGLERALRRRIKGGEEAGVELDRLGRDVLRAEAALSRSAAMLARIEQSLPLRSTGRSVADAIVRSSYLPEALAMTRAGGRKAAEGRDAANALVLRAIEAGARVEPRFAVIGDGSGERLEDVQPGRAGEWSAGAGGWLGREAFGEGDDGVAAGVEGGPAVGADGAAAAGVGGATGTVEYGPDGLRTYEGPLPEPSLVWSARLVDAIVLRHPSLDAVDARLLLGLVGLAYPELSTRALVEEAVRGALTRPQGLDLLGAERRLSELHESAEGDPGAEGSEGRPVIRFVLRLPTASGVGE